MEQLIKIQTNISGEQLVSTAYATSKGIGYIHKIFKDEIK